MTFRAIHTLDARGNILLALLERGFDVRDAAMRRFIWQTADELSRLLSSQGVEYARLKSALVPQPNKQEIACSLIRALPNRGLTGSTFTDASFLSSTAGVATVRASAI